MSLAVEPAEPVRSVRSAEPVRTAIVRRDARAAGEFERFLGDPRDAASVITIERSIDLDERSEFPHEPVAAVGAWGLQQWYVPEAHGGLLRDVLVPMMMIRRIASRDLTVAVAVGKSFLGAVGAWIAGGPIAPTMADLVLSGDPVAWGLTERGRGSDLSNTATTASVGDRIVVDGAKWPINSGRRCRAMTVLARTGETGPRALSLVLVDKQRLETGAVTPLPKVPTHGIRGGDISGLAFDRAVVEPDRLVGPQGHGLEIVLKSLQLTRPLCTALSLGAADHVVAIALEFAATRELYGRGLADLPSARATLGTAVADALLAESVMVAGAREVHGATDEMALVSAFVKSLVPTTVDLLVRDLTAFLGARSQVIGIAGAGAFQKAARDNRVVGIFDGNSIVNLNMIINEFTSITRDADPVDGAALVQEFRFDAGPEGWIDAARLRLLTRRGSRLLRALPSLVELLDGRPSSIPAHRIASEYRRLLELAREAPREALPSAASFDLASRLALCFGAACAIAVGLAGPEPDSAASETRLLATLERVAVRLGLRSAPSTAASAAAVADLALEYARTGRRVSVLEGWEVDS